MPDRDLTDRARTSRDGAIARWADAAGGGSTCRIGGGTDRVALKRAEGAATALRQLVRRLDGGEDAASALAEELGRWSSPALTDRGDDWRHYTEGGLAALEALASCADGLAGA
ncbi:hypothetical protein J4N02_11835 [Propioniciclava sp. MC1595]|uniref:hypothetical protein n=1 Tax=Propioniciclava sp. MC1595 TaxID=2760308 RepID=UPI0016623875|nr:hypothetical protein [Propioniciclava sp. MC1595]MBB1494242.1 hypothetical protein [Propioniciclava sp. MC1595]QTE25220.1 hypothetical protein J4N02_11835 [Propioniciclava sp. MC1595]